MDSFGLVYPLIPGYKSGLGFGLVCRLGLGLGGTLKRGAVTYNSSRQSGEVVFIQASHTNIEEKFSSGKYSRIKQL